LLQRGIFLLSFRRMAGRRSGVHGGEQRVDSAMKCVQFLSEMFVGDDKALVGALRRESASGANEV
jgi:hypothetical protein